jgi:hypothetical protein
MNAPVDSAARRGQAWFLFRVFWVAVQLVVVYWFAQQGDLFFYQGF